MSEENRPREEGRERTGPAEERHEGTARPEGSREKSAVDKAIDKAQEKIDEAQRSGLFDKAAKKIQDKLKGR